jgi:hypothetical protein
MIRSKNPAGKALFRSVSKDGTDWLFVNLWDEGWAITRDGERTAAGGCDARSIAFGVQTFLSLSKAVVVAAASNAAVRQHLDRIEAKSPLARGVPTEKALPGKALPGRTSRENGRPACFSTPYRRP